MKGRDDHRGLGNRHRLGVLRGQHADTQGYLTGPDLVGPGRRQPYGHHLGGARVEDTRAGSTVLQAAQSPTTSRVYASTMSPSLRTVSVVVASAPGDTVTVGVSSSADVVTMRR